MDIKEIALKVGLQAFEEHPYDKGHVVSPSGYTWIDDKLIEFAEALIAEIAKQNEPVAFTNSAQLGYVTSGQHQDIPLAMWSRNTSYSGADIPLYTIPPTAEQIANETAEACAAYLTSGRYMVLNPGVLISAEQHTQYIKNHDIYQANAVRSGAWKEFKK